MQDGRRGEREKGRVLGFDVEADREGVRRWEGEEWPVNTQAAGVLGFPCSHQGKRNRLIKELKLGANNTIATALRSRKQGRKGLKSVGVLVTRKEE